MRIIAGQWGGRPIHAPRGSETTRPTADRVREAIASVVISRLPSLEGARVLDAFAGSGALGLEFLSRGAAFATLVDADREALSTIRANVETLHVRPTQVRVLATDALGLARRGRAVPGGPFSVVLLDPPYATQASQIADLVDSLVAAGQVVPGALVLYERDASRPTLTLSSAELDVTKRYGTTCVDVFVVREPDALDDAQDTEPTEGDAR